MIPASSSRRSAALPASTPPAGPARPRISGQQWSGSTANSATRTAAPDLSRSSPSPGRTADAELFRGEVEGSLIWPPRGDRGFGYDPMFIPRGGNPDLRRNRPGEKHRISHRARAFAKLVERCFRRAGAWTPPLAVYIHWPFCRSKCPYCDFNSHVRDGVDAGALDAGADRRSRAPGRAHGRTGSRSRCFSAAARRR